MLEMICSAPSLKMYGKRASGTDPQKMREKCLFSPGTIPCKQFPRKKTRGAIYSIVVYST
jgi:hypothetical protein